MELLPFPVLGIKVVVGAGICDFLGMCATSHMSKTAAQLNLYLTETENSDKGEFCVLSFPQCVKSFRHVPKNKPNSNRKAGEKHE
jgi:hypothetical protein